MRQLLWKEWHEQSWKLAFGCLVLGSIAFIGLHSRIISDQLMVMWVCFLGLALFPILASTGLIPAERAEGSFESLISLPVSPWKILLGKAGIGLALCVGPMILAALLSLLVVNGREISNHELIILYLRSTLASLSLFFWMLAITARLPSEARAGLVAIGLLIMWVIATVGLSSPSVPQWILECSPCAFFYGLNDITHPPPPLIPTIIFQLPILILLMMLTVRSFKQIA